MLVEAEDVSVAIGGRQVLDGECVRCEPGTMTALVGPSGSGKTTLLHCLGLLLLVNRGRILIDGKDVTRYGSAARRRFWRDHVAFVLQDYGIMDEESVAFNVTMQSSLLGRRATGDGKRFVQVLEQTGLAGRQDEVASHLSGGEKQRLALARAIYKRAAVVFVDEPTASLDAANRRKVIALFAELAASGCTVIVSTHDSEMIDACGSRQEIGSGRTAPYPVSQSH
ncbi:ABC transporter ATP-binding protein [Micromonospora sp. KC721]|uniref:ABC transporter ATP-binding protein n=1 Tax=Micromonospora sp. KC721 TaxID=2530380 RepID=UPI001051ACC4|nr:ATP-binding cassette domain-containing protein [Micromonospora sp. KC721]TDB82181.1 ATP-binding cassette domain-containing protein [Micromonospora sp. KC721]